MRQNIPPSLNQCLADIVGLRQIEITNRYPYQILTALYPEVESLSTQCRTGYIYQKETTVPPELIEDFLGAANVINDTALNFQNIKMGDRVFSTDPEAMDVKSQIERDYREYQSAISELSQRFVITGSNSESVSRFQSEADRFFQHQILALQQHFQELLDTYNQLIFKYESGGIDQDELWGKMGIVEGEYKYESTRWPLALNLISEEGNAHQIVSQFANADFASLFPDPEPKP